MSGTMRNVQHALRSLRKAPGFTAGTILLFACGIGIATVMLNLIGRGFSSGRSTAHPDEILALEATGGLTRWSVRMLSPSQAQRENLESLLVALLILTLFAVAIACVNAVILLLSRAAARNREMAVRAALGATPVRLARHLSVEGTILAVGAGVLGLGFGAGGVLLLRTSWPAALPPWLDAPELRATLVGVGVPLLLALLVSIGPALRGRGRRLAASLTTGTRASASRGEGFLQRSFLIMAVTATTLLLTSAALLLQATAPGDRAMGGEGDAINRVDVAADVEADVGDPAAADRQGADHRSGGLNPEGVFTMQVDPGPGADDPAAFYETMLALVRGTEGVSAASFASPGTVMGLGVRDHVTVDCGRCSMGGLALPVFATFARHHVIGPGYFDTLGISIQTGREFTLGDRADSTPVAIVNEAYRGSFERGDPVGRHILVGGFGSEWHRVIGVVREPRLPGIGAGSPTEPTVYLPALQHPPTTAMVTFRTAGETRELERTISQVHAGVGGLAMLGGASHPAPLSESLEYFAAPLRWFTGIFGAIALVSVLLAIGALYSVLSGSVNHRRREIGVRMALGATPARVVRSVVGDGLRMTLIGTISGFVAATGVVALLQEAFHGVRVFDVRVHAGVLLLLLLVALLASGRPARRAAAVHPQVAMRGE